MSARPRLVVTAGEPAGIGPDLCVTTAAEFGDVDITMVGDPRVLAGRAAALGAVFEPDIVSDPASAPAESRLTLVALNYPEPDCLGHPEPANAKEQLRGLALAADLTRRGRFDALVTAPLHKGVINDAGIAFSGHTEFLAERLDVPMPVMLLTSGSLRVALATTHLPLADVAAAITGERLTRVVSVLDRDLRDRYGIERPRIVVCGLNPHAGEGGHLGREDDEIIAPAVQSLRRGGIDVHGPVAADTAFTPAVGHADAILAMYHDQGLPVIKYASFGHAVNVTLGLPIVRTSVDHGTALSLAGTGRIDAGSFRAAVAEARALASR